MISTGSLSWIPSHGEIATFSRLFTLFGVVSLIAMVFHSIFKATTSSARQRAKMIFFGVTIAFLPSVFVTLAVFFLRVNIRKFSINSGRKLKKFETSPLHCAMSTMYESNFTASDNS